MGSPVACAYTVVGVIIDKEKLYEEAEVHHSLCRPHSWNNNEWLYTGVKPDKCQCPDKLEGKYCPECGQPSYIRVRKPRDGVQWDEKLNGLDFVEAYGENLLAVGILIGSVQCGPDDPEQHITKNELPNINEMVDTKSKCKKVLEPLGLWNKPDFGIITVATF